MRQSERLVIRSLRPGGDAEQQRPRYDADPPQDLIPGGWSLDRFAVRDVVAGRPQSPEQQLTFFFCERDSISRKAGRQPEAERRTVQTVDRLLNLLFC